MSTKCKRLWQRANQAWAGLEESARLILIYTLISSLGFSILQLFTNLYILSLGYQQDFLGLLLSITSLPAIALSMPVGFLANRVGSKRVLLWGRWATAGTLALFALSTSAPALIITRLLNGLAQILVNVALFPLLTQCCPPEQRTALFSGQRAFQTFASVIGSLVGGFLPNWFASLLGVGPESMLAYRGTLLVAIVFMAASALPLSRIRVGERIHARRRYPGLAIFGMLPKWGRIIAPNVLIILGASLFVPFLNVFFREEFGVSNASLGSIFAMMNLVIGLATLGGPWVVRRLGLVRAIVTLQITPLPLMVVMAFSRFLPLVLVCHWVRAAIARMSGPLASLFIMEQVSDDERSLINGLEQTANRLGSATMPYISGVIQVNYGFAPLFLGAGAIYLVASLLLYALFGGQESSALHNET